MSVARITWKGVDFRRNTRRGQVRLAVHHSRDRGCDVATCIGIIWKAAGHEQRAEISVTEAQRPEVMRVLGYLFCRIACVIDNDLLRRDHDIDRLPKSLDVKPPTGRHKL